MSPPPWQPQSRCLASPPGLLWSLEVAEEGQDHWQQRVSPGWQEMSHLVPSSQGLQSASVCPPQTLGLCAALTPGTPPAHLILQTHCGGAPDLLGRILGQARSRSERETEAVAPLASRMASPGFHRPLRETAQSKHTLPPFLLLGRLLDVSLLPVSGSSPTTRSSPPLLAGLLLATS